MKMLKFLLKFSWICSFPMTRLKYSSLIQKMTCCRAGDKPLSEPMLVLFTYAYMRDPVSFSGEGLLIPVFYVSHWENIDLPPNLNHIYMQKYSAAVIPVKYERDIQLIICILVVLKCEQRNEGNWSRLIHQISQIATTRIIVLYPLYIRASTISHYTYSYRWLEITNWSLQILRIYLSAPIWSIRYHH